VPGGASPGEERIFAAELIAALSLATDLAMGFDFEHGLRSTLVAARLAERLGVDRETAVRTKLSFCRHFALDVWATGLGHEAQARVPTGNV
jgi:hypothetical protein